MRMPISSPRPNRSRPALPRKFTPGGRRPRDFAIFYRMNALSRALEFALRDQGVPYQMVKGLEFYQRKEIKDVLGYLQLLNNPRDDVALLRVINVPPRGIGTRLARPGWRSMPADTGCRCWKRPARRAWSNRWANGPPWRSPVSWRFTTACASWPRRRSRRSWATCSASRATNNSSRDSDDEEDEERLANIEELLTAARQFDEQHPGEGHLEEFLEEASLVNDTDAWAEADDRVTLMTLHASKGLEFPVVFIVALEEGLLPHERSRSDNDQLEEERRLLFVGMTRAEQELALSLAVYREFRGQRRRSIPSAFLMELPRSEMQVNESVARSTWASVVDEHTQAELEEFVGDEHVEEEVHAHGESRRDEVHKEEVLGNAASAISASADEADEIEDAHEAGGSAARMAVASLRLTTAAQLDGGPQSEPAAVSPDVFHQDMVVSHPQYGLGKIVALSGTGPRRQATVAFAAGAGQRKFILMKSALRPAK